MHEFSVDWGTEPTNQHQRIKPRAQTYNIRRTQNGKDKQLDKWTRQRQTGMVEKGGQ